MGAKARGNNVPSITNTINKTLNLSDSSTEVSMLFFVWPLDNLIAMFQNSISSLYHIVIYQTFSNTHQVANLL